MDLGETTGLQARTRCLNPIRRSGRSALEDFATLLCHRRVIRQKPFVAHSTALDGRLGDQNEINCPQILEQALRELRVLVWGPIVFHATLLSAT